MYYEDHNDIMNVEFKGDTLMVAGKRDDGTINGTLSFIDNCGKCMPINQDIMTDDEWLELRTKQGIVEDGIITDDKLNTFLRFVFEKTESIDALIYTLRGIKANMISDLEIIEPHPQTPPEQPDPTQKGE